MAVSKGKGVRGDLAPRDGTGHSSITRADEQEDEVEKFREFLDTITPEDFGRAT